MLDQLVSRLPEGLQPYAKAVLPALAAILAAAIHGLTAGTIDRLEMEIALVGLLAATVAFAVDNAPEGLRAYAKAIVPALMTCAAVIVHALLAGEWDAQAWTLGLSGLGASALTLLTPNATVSPVDGEVDEIAAGIRSGSRARDLAGDPPPPELAAQQAGSRLTPDVPPAS